MGDIALGSAPTSALGPVGNRPWVVPSVPVAPAVLKVALLQVASPATETVAARRERVGQMVAAANSC